MRMSFPQVRDEQEISAEGRFASPQPLYKAAGWMDFLGQASSICPSSN